MMWIKDDTRHLQIRGRTGVTIGAFDGVHRGHKALINTLVNQARDRGYQPLILTFDPPPRQVFQPEEHGLLSTLDERLALFEPLGVDGVIILPFNDTLINTPAEAFVQRLVDDLNLGGLWIGADFSMGRGGEGNATRLKALGHSYQFDVHILRETVTWEGEPVSSSRIREAIKQGSLAEVNGCLGHPYHVTSLVQHGDHRGRKLGFPTANLYVNANRLLPPNGVYVCEAHLKQGHYPAVTNVGVRPTFQQSGPTVEAHLLDFEDNIYHMDMKLEFLAYLRPEIRYSSVDALIAQMHQDKRDARAWWAKHRSETRSGIPT
jgi:riboflavin kinase/FMN adenylyltransferase